MNKLKILLPLLVVAGGVAVAAVIVNSRPEVERRSDSVPPPLVRAITVSLEDLRLNVESQGTVEPVTESTLVAQVPGQVVWVSPSFAEGAFFKRGATLLRIDPRDYELHVAQAEARVAQAQVGVEREVAEADLAKEEWQELGEGEPSALTAREPQLAEARAGLRAAEAELERAQLDLSRTDVRAPFAGRVGSKLVDLGQFVGAGTRVAAVFSTDFAEIRLPVSEADLGFLEIDLGSTPSPDARPPVRLSGSIGGHEAIWEGSVVRSGSRFDERTRMLELFARVDDPFGGGDRSPLPMGLFVQAEIGGREVTGVAVLPRAAIREGDQVLVIDEDRLLYRDVELLRLAGEQAIVSSGLEEGEQVCISTLEVAVDGMSVRVQLEDDQIRTDQEEEARL